MTFFSFFFFGSIISSNPEVLSCEGLTELPIGRGDVPRGWGAPVAPRNPKRQRLSHQHCVWLPVLTPVAAHGHPASLGPLHQHAHDIPCTRDVGDQDQVEVAEAVDSEPDPTVLAAWHPAQISRQPLGHFGHLIKAKLFFLLAWNAVRDFRVGHSGAWINQKPFPHRSTSLILSYVGDCARVLCFDWLGIEDHPICSWLTVASLILLSKSTERSRSSEQITGQGRWASDLEMDYTDHTVPVDN